MSTVNKVVEISYVMYWTWLSAP